MWEVIIAGAAAIKVPSLFESAVRSVGERLLGPVLDNFAQPVKDRAQQRSRVAQAIADLAVREIENNPELFRAEVNNLLKRAGARTDRIEATFIKSLKHLGSKAQESTSEPAVEAPSDDWLNRWARYVEDASSEGLQDAFARILAGEIERKGKFSIGTLRLVSEMSMEIANDFEAIWSEVIEGYAVKYPGYNRGADWERLSRLRDTGLVSAFDASIHRPVNKSPFWSFGDEPTLLVQVNPNISSEVPIINITRLGLELGSILPPPDKAANLRRLAVECPNKAGWEKATLLTQGEPRQELVWEAPAPKR